MELNVVVSPFRHRRTTSSERLLGISSSSPPSSSTITNGFELNEDDILWTSDLLGPDNRDHHNTTTNNHRNSRPLFHRNSGILAALPDTDNDRPVLYRKPTVYSPSASSSSSSRKIPWISRPPPDSWASTSQSRKFQHSAPVNVPVLTMAMEKQRNNRTSNFIVDDVMEEKEEILPPHEIVARGASVSPKTTFSVLEGVGRTLKGRDLRQVRNAIWRKTGFLD